MTLTVINYTLIRILLMKYKKHNQQSDISSASDYI